MAAFDLADVNHAPAFFDVKKLEWMNGEYLRAMSVDDFVEAARPVDGAAGAPWPPERFDEAVFRTHGAARPGAGGGAGRGARPWSTSSSSRSPASTRRPGRRWPRTTPAAGHPRRRLDAYRRLRVDGRRPAQRHPGAGRRAWAASSARPRRPIRVAVTGRRVGPPLFESLEVLGREAVLARLRVARERLGADTG